MANPQPKLPKAYSCVRCFERKVKCDKQHPCAGCMRARVECIFRIPAAPRRRTKKAQDESLVARLKHYEELLRTNGIDVPHQSSEADRGSAALSPTEEVKKEDDFRESAIDHPGPGPFEHSGQLIVDQGRSRFVENKLWSTLTGEFRQPHEALSDSSEDEEERTPADDTIDFLLGHTPSSLASPLHPSAEHIFKLWQIFLTNVNPMMKIVHQPTLQEAIVSASTNLDDISKSLEALMFAIYGSAVFSMTDAECRATFDESQNALLARYRTGARRALTRAKLLGTSDIVVLQAFAIYLMAMRKTYDARTMWTLSGVANRIGQGMGLHHDGVHLGLPPFETEMRRRLCWQLNLLDFRSAELSGFGGFGDINWWNTDIPSNINDADIWPGMKHPPEPQTRPTEMVGCLVRYEIGRFWKEKLEQKRNHEGNYNLQLRSWVAGASTDERDQFINELESRIEEKYLKYCDLSIPIQFMATIAGRMICKSMRVMAYHPRKFERPENMPEHARQTVWKTCLALLEADNLLHTYRALRRFKWHTDVYFQWQALICVLGELISRPVGEDKSEAWAQVEDIFRNHPDFLSDSKKPVHVAIGRIAMKAWDAREKAQNQNLTDTILPTPNFIIQLQELNAASDAKHASSQASSADPSTLITTTQNMNLQQSPSRQNSSQVTPYTSHSSTSALTTSEYPPSLSTTTTAPPSTSFAPGLLPTNSMDDIGMDWTRWDSLLNDYDVGSLGATPNPPQTQGSMFGAPQMPYSTFMPQYTDAQLFGFDRNMPMFFPNQQGSGNGEGGMRHEQQHSGL